MPHCNTYVITMVPAIIDTARIIYIRFLNLRWIHHNKEGMRRFEFALHDAVSSVCGKCFGSKDTPPWWVLLTKLGMFPIWFALEEAMCGREQVPTPQHSRWKQLILARDLSLDASGIWGDRKSRETRMADRWPRKVSRSGLAAVKDLPVIYSFVPGPMGTAAAAAAGGGDVVVVQHTSMEQMMRQCWGKLLKGVISWWRMLNNWRRGGGLFFLKWSVLKKDKRYVFTAWEYLTACLLLLLGVPPCSLDLCWDVALWEWFVFWMLR